MSEDYDPMISIARANLEELTFQLRAYKRDCKELRKRLANSERQLRIAESIIVENGWRDATGDDNG